MRLILNDILIGLGFTFVAQVFYYVFELFNPKTLPEKITAVLFGAFYIYASGHVISGFINGTF